jgi:hypothetical protein
MSGLAVQRTDLDASAPERTSRKRISKRMQQALSHLATKGVNQREAAKLAGLSEYHLSRELKKPQIQAFIARKSRENIQLGVLRASVRINELVDASSEHVSLDASKHVLAIEGIRPPDQGQVSVNVGVSVGYVIDLSGKAGNPSATVIDAQLTHDEE